MKTLMNRRDFLKTAGLTATSLAVPGCASGSWQISSEPAANKPNIVLIMADDLGYECLSCYGSASYKTPVLDELARTGMRFEHCYSQPLCTPSRIKLMTGKYNFRNYTTFGHLDLNETTFGHILQKAGYATCIVEKWQLAGDPTAPKHAGFDEYCLQCDPRVFPGQVRPHRTDNIPNQQAWLYMGPAVNKNGELIDYPDNSYGPDIYCDYILDFMERHKSEPFFAYYPMVLTHEPFIPTPDSKDWGRPLTEEDVQGSKYFPDMVAYMDKMVGRVVRKLDELGLRKNTLILFTGDNGADHRVTSRIKDGSIIQGGKTNSTDGGTHVPLIANWNGMVPSGKVCTDLIDFSDFFPTLAEVGGASLDKNAKIDGRSFLPQLLGEKGNPREWVFCYSYPNNNYPLKIWAREKRYKLYDNGNLFDVPADTLEKHPIPPGTGSKKAEAARKRLQTVLDSMGYKTRLQKDKQKEESKNRQPRVRPRDEIRNK